MIFEQIQNGGDRNLGYLLADEKTGRAVAVDPSYQPDYYIQRALELEVELVNIICTHSHHDHVNGNDHIIEKLGIDVVMYEDAEYFYDVEVSDGDIFKVGSIDIKVIHTPGHCEDGMCLLIEDKLITGDTLYLGKVGGTSTEEEARKEFNSLRSLMKLEDKIEVFPGHDFGVTPSSTIGLERKTNPFIIQPTFEEFLHLKANWLAYKTKHGLQ